jgi:uncharacterized protein (DUF952 family)
LEKHFKHKGNLMLIALEEARLGPALRWEQSCGGELFPHLYADIDTAHMLWQRPLAADVNGVPCLDDRWFEC